MAGSRAGLRTDTQHRDEDVPIFPPLFPPREEREKKGAGVVSAKFGRIPLLGTAGYFSAW